MGIWWFVIVLGLLVPVFVGGVFGYLAGLELGFRVGRGRGERRRERERVEYDRSWERVGKLFDQRELFEQWRDRRDGR